MYFIRVNPLHFARSKKWRTLLGWFHLKYPMCKNTISLNPENRFSIMGGFTVPEGLLNIKTCQYYCVFKVNLLLSVNKIEPTKWEFLCIKRKAIDIRRHWIQPKRHQINTSFLLAVFLHKSLASMLADNVLGWEIALKISCFPLKLYFLAKYSFFRQTLSLSKGFIYLIVSMVAELIRIPSNFISNWPVFKHSSASDLVSHNRLLLKLTMATKENQAPCAVTPLSSYYITLTSA